MAADSFIAFYGIKIGIDPADEDMPDALDSRSDHCVLMSAYGTSIKKRGSPDVSRGFLLIPLWSDRDQLPPALSDACATSTPNIAVAPTPPMIARLSPTKTRRIFMAVSPLR
jgi:hypothetical protein